MYYDHDALVSAGYELLEHHDVGEMMVDGQPITNMQMVQIRAALKWQHGIANFLSAVDGLIEDLKHERASSPAGVRQPEE